MSNVEPGKPGPELASSTHVPPPADFLATGGDLGRLPHL